MEIKKICVIGGGLMGRQIALCASIYGFDATVYDLKPEVLEAVGAWEDEYLAGRIKTEMGIEDVRINYVGSVIGSHSGPGTLALFFLGNER